MTDLRSPKVPLWAQLTRVLALTAGMFGAIYTAAKGEVAMTVFLSAWSLGGFVIDAIETAAGDIIRATGGDR